MGVAVLSLVAGTQTARALEVVSVEPAAHSLLAPTNASIVVHFDRPLNTSSVVALRSFWAFGRWSGTATGSFTFFNGDMSVRLDPSAPFSAGEQVMVILSQDLEAADGSTLRAAGYSFQFWTRAGLASREFAQVQQLTTRTTSPVSSRAYGGIATDLNNDGFLDVTIVNEDTADLRVFLNQADSNGTLSPFEQPTTPVGNRASPNEPSDFDRDGNADLAVANINDDTVSILLGNGDGTFGPQQVLSTGTQPRGLAVLDADGDGDVDIVVTNAVSSDVSLYLNDGTGVFTVDPRFEGGGNGEWALAAGDMDDDGILDLVIGARSSQTIVVNRGNGDGTFTSLSTQSSGGATWMLNIADVNGNGTEDVAAINSSGNNGAILLGVGDGTLGAPQTYATDSFGIATDLGDLDGDGDLDWVTSSFGGDWMLFVNDGSGNFTFDQRFTAPSAASCCLMLDVDNDGDLDLALIDEIADVVLVMENVGSPAVPAASTWSLVLLSIGLLVAATLVVGKGQCRRGGRGRCGVRVV